MTYVITDIEENTLIFDNAKTANKYIQEKYKAHDDLYPTVESIEKNIIFIIYERIGGIYE